MPLFEIKQESIVIVPRRPINIITIRVAWLTVHKVGVRFRDKPTVAKAETTSNMIKRVSVCGSKIDNIITPVPITNRDENITIKARLIECFEIERCRISIWSRPRKVLITFRAAMAKVVVFIPPAVDIGEPPIHIYTIIITTVIFVSAPISNALKPAVRGVVERKNEVDNLPYNDVSSSRTLLYSVIKNIIVPLMTKIFVTTMAITVLDVRVLALCLKVSLLWLNILWNSIIMCCLIHCHTLKRIGKPIPPKIINHDTELSNI